MPQFPSWKLPTAAWTDAVGSHTPQVRLALADLATRGRDATDDVAAPPVTSRAAHANAGKPRPVRWST